MIELVIMGTKSIAESVIAIKVKKKYTKLSRTITDARPAAAWSGARQKAAGRHLTACCRASAQRIMSKPRTAKLVAGNAHTRFGGKYCWHILMPRSSNGVYMIVPPAMNHKVNEMFKPCVIVNSVTSVMRMAVGFPRSTYTRTAIIACKRKVATSILAWQTKNTQ